MAAWLIISLLLAPSAVTSLSFEHFPISKGSTVPDRPYTNSLPTGRPGLHLDTAQKDSTFIQLNLHNPLPADSSRPSSPSTSISTNNSRRTSNQNAVSRGVTKQRNRDRERKPRPRSRITTTTRPAQPIIRAQAKPVNRSSFKSVERSSSSAPASRTKSQSARGSLRRRPSKQRNSIDDEPKPITRKTTSRNRAQSLVRQDVELSRVRSREQIFNENQILPTSNPNLSRAKATKQNFRPRTREQVETFSPTVPPTPARTDSRKRITTLSQPTNAIRNTLRTEESPRGKIRLKLPDDVSSQTKPRSDKPRLRIQTPPTSNTLERRPSRPVVVGRTQDTLKTSLLVQNGRPLPKKDPQPSNRARNRERPAATPSTRFSPETTTTTTTEKPIFKPFFTNHIFKPAPAIRFEDEPPFVPDTIRPAITTERTSQRPSLSRQQVQSSDSRIPAAVIRDPQPSVFLPTLPTARPTTPTTTTVTTSRPQPLPVRPDSIPTRASVAPPPRANFVEKSPQQSATRPLTPVSIFRQPVEPAPSVPQPPSLPRREPTDRFQTFSADPARPTGVEDQLILSEDDIFASGFRKFALNAAQITWNQDPFRKITNSAGKPTFDIDYSKNPAQTNPLPVLLSSRNNNKDDLPIVGARFDDRPRSIRLEEPSVQSTPRLEQPSALPPLPFSASLLPFTGKVTEPAVPTKSRPATAQSRPAPPQRRVTPAEIRPTQETNNSQKLVDADRHQQLQQFEAALLARQNAPRSQQQDDDINIAAQFDDTISPANFNGRQRNRDTAPASALSRRPALAVNAKNSVVSGGLDTAEAVTWTPAILHQDFQTQPVQSAQRAAKPSVGGASVFADFSSNFDADFFGGIADQEAQRFTKSLPSQQQRNTPEAFSFVSQSGPAFSYSSQL